MSENVVINDTTYNGVDALALVRADGTVATFYPDAVRYNEQTLTDEQKAQARANIGITGTGADGEKGETGQRGTGILKVTTAPASYTTAIGSYTPKYRIALSTVKDQSGVADVLIGDTIQYSYYHYYVDHLDSSYAYISKTRVSIRGATGAAGTTPVKGTDYYTDADKAEMVTAVKASMPALTITGIDADGVSHSWTVYGVAQ